MGSKPSKDIELENKNIIHNLIYDVYNNTLFIHSRVFTYLAALDDGFTDKTGHVHLKVDKQGYFLILTTNEIEFHIDEPFNNKTVKLTNIIGGNQIYKYRSLLLSAFSELVANIAAYNQSNELIELIEYSK